MFNSSSFLASWLLIAAANTGRIVSADPLEKVDLDVEYALIQQKKSKLSVALRSRVVHIVERNKHRTNENLSS